MSSSAATSRTLHKQQPTVANPCHASALAAPCHTAPQQMCTLASSASPNALPVARQAVPHQKPASSLAECAPECLQSRHTHQPTQTRAQPSSLVQTGDSPHKGPNAAVKPVATNTEHVRLRATKGTGCDRQGTQKSAQCNHLTMEHCSKGDT